MPLTAAAVSVSAIGAGFRSAIDGRDAVQRSGRENVGAAVLRGNEGGVVSAVQNGGWSVSVSVGRCRASAAAEMSCCSVVSIVPVGVMTCLPNSRGAGRAVAGSGGLCRAQCRWTICWIRSRVAFCVLLLDVSADVLGGDVRHGAAAGRAAVPVRSRRRVPGRRGWCRGRCRCCQVPSRCRWSWGCWSCPGRACSWGWSG